MANYYPVKKLTLYLFNISIVPNKGAYGNYFVSKTLINDETSRYNARKKYIDKLNNYGLYLTFTAENFKIFAYNGYVDVNVNNYATTVGMTFEKYRYLAIDTTEEIFFYHVTKFELYPNFVRLYITPDLWANNYDYATFTAPVVTKTNVQLGEDNDGVVYRVKHFSSNDEGFASYRGVELYKDDINAYGEMSRKDIRIFAVIRSEQDQQLNVNIENQNLYMFSPANILNKNSDDLTADDIYAAIEAVASIYQNTNWVIANAITQKMFLWYNDLSVLTSGFQTFKAYINNAEKNITGYQVRCQWKQLRFIARIGTRINPDWQQDVRISVINPDGYNELKDCTGATIYFGVRSNGIELPKVVGNISIGILISFQNDGMEIIANCDNKSYDLTDAFSISFVSNTGTLNNIQRISKTISTIASGAGAIAQITQGGAGIISGGAQLGQVFTPEGAKSGTYVKGGDGLNTFEYIIRNNTGNIFFYTIMQSDYYLFATHDPYPAGAMSEWYAAEYGADVEYTPQRTFDSLLLYIATTKKSLFNITSQINIAAETQVFDVPDEAIDYITNAIAAGINVIWVE